MDVHDLRGKAALVTGGGSGIGKQTALAFGRAGADLIICDVNAEGLAATEAELRRLGCRVLAQRVDVSVAGEVEAFAGAVHREYSAVDILMNNAGVGLGGGMLDTELADWQWIVGINLWGVIYGCHFFVPAMVKRGRGGHVINVSSAAGYAGTETLVAYCTTKFGVLGFSEAIREELAPHGIGVTTVCPGIINTPITRSSRMRGPAATEEARRLVIQAYERRNYGPERVAKNILKAVARNRAVAPISPEAWALYYLKRLAPRLTAWIGHRTNVQAQRQLAESSQGDPIR